jgi:hypothetical protein
MQPPVPADRTPLEELEEYRREIERLANEVSVRAQAFGAQVGSRPRIELVRQRLKIALDELDAYPYTAEDITDE